MYSHSVPATWDDALQAHRGEVRDAITRATWRLAREHGLLAVTMSQVAQESGISRATLYKYFSDVDAILTTWHQQQVQTHLAELAAARDGTQDAQEQVQAVLTTYARVCRRRAEHGPGELQDLLHHGRDLDTAHRRLVDLVDGVLAAAVAQGAIRADQPTSQLTAYCLRAMTAAADLPAGADVTGLVDLVMVGLRTPSTP